MNNIIYKNEVKRAYIVLGYRAESQNTIDINGLYEDNMVDEIERDALLKYNKEFHWKIGVNNMDKIDKKTYIGIVKFTLESMVDLAKSDKNYNLTADTIHYYETTIKPEMQISQDEFLELCKEVGIK